MRAIYKREVGACFNSMAGWLFIAVMTAFVGIYFMAYNLYSGVPYFSTTLSAVLFLFMVLVPLLTMRSMAEERRARTDQLLLTAPVTVAGVVLGKYLALLTVFAAPTAIAGLCPLIIKLNGTAFLRADYAALFAFFLLGAVEIAVGLFISALTESQIIAAVGTFFTLLALYLWDDLLGFLPTTAFGSLAGLAVVLALVCLAVNALSDNWMLSGGTGLLGLLALAGFYLRDSAAFEGLLADLLGRFSLLSAFNAFASDHVFDLRGLALYGSLIALALFLVCQVLQKRRWN